MSAADRLSENKQLDKKRSPTVHFSDNLSAVDIISSDIPASQEEVYLFYNPPLKSATNEICVINSAKPSKTAQFCFFFSGNKAFYSFAVSFSKTVFLIFPLNVKFSKCLFCLQMADKIERRISNRKGYIA